MDHLPPAHTPGPDAAAAAPVSAGLRATAVRTPALDYPSRPAVWYGFDLDRTLAHYEHWRGVDHIGEPLQPMLDKLKQYIAEGKRCKIFTARVWYDRTEITFSRLSVTREEVKSWLSNPNVHPAYKRLAESIEAYHAIHAWVMQHVGTTLEITCEKDPWCLELWDDIARPVYPNNVAPCYSVVGTYPDGCETPLISGIVADSPERAAELARYVHGRRHGNEDGDLLEVNYVFAGHIEPVLAL